MTGQAILTILRSADSTAEAAQERARRFCEALAAGIAVSELGPQRTVGGFLIPVLGPFREQEREAALRAGLTLVSTRTVKAG